MMTSLGRLWTWWTEGRRSARTARLQYIGMAVAFGALALIALVLGEPVVAAFAAVATAVCATLAAVAPRIALAASRADERQTDGR
jgi:hypothetical protein